MPPDSPKPQFSAIDELFGTLLERLETRYPMKLERDQKIIEIDVTGLQIAAKELEDGMIVVECDFADEEGIHSRTGGVIDSADAIEGVLSKFTVSTREEEKPQPRKRWWQFGKS